MDVKTIVLGTVAPIAGCIMSTLMYASPLKACYTARKTRNLGELNPVPFAVTVWSTAIWVTYGFAAQNVFMFPANILGLSAALFNSITCYALASDKAQVKILQLVCSAAVVLPLLAVISYFGLHTFEERTLMWGLLANIITILYYGAPLSTARDVVRTRNSASLYRPTCVMNLLNGALWVAYGIAVGDYWIYIPNGAGVVCATILLLLCAMYPATPLPRSPKDSTQHLLSGSGPASCAPQQAGKEGSDSGAIVVKVDAHGGRQANAALGGLLTSAVSPSRRGLELAMSSSQL